MEVVTIELRPRLGSCNVFVSLAEEASDPSGIRVKLSPDKVCLKVGRRSYNLCLNAVRIIPSSLSSLRVAGSWVSFRVQTMPLDPLYGSFVAELLGGLQKENISLATSKELPPKDTDLTFSCSCCAGALTEVLNLKKVLPLPDSEPSDFFCCSHSAEDYWQLLEPRNTDYFYAPYYAVINRNNFTKKLKINSESVACGRCLAVIGQPNSDYSLKIWNCCVNFSGGKDDGNSKANGLADFEAAVRNSSSLGFVNDGILLEAKESGKTRYLAVKPIEWNLNLLVEPREITESMSLRPQRVVKVLYDYGETMNEDWKNANRVQIGLKCMLAGMEHLLLSSKRIPPVYRNSDEQHIGYIHMSDQNP